MPTPTLLRSGAAGLLALAAALACSPAEPADDRPLVAVSVVPFQYAVDRIAGDRVRVVVMIPPGANPTSHEPTLAELRALSEASLYVKVGHPNFAFERAWLDGLLAESPGLPVVDASEGLERRAGDPHVWVAPRPFEQIAVRIGEALAALLPEERAALEANLEALRGEIRALDAEIAASLAASGVRRFYVFHPAWGYLADAYDLEQVAVEHEHREPDARRLAELIARAEEDGAKVVFVQPQFDPAAAETLAREVGARVERLDPLAYDWPANLRHVADAIASAGR